MHVTERDFTHIIGGTFEDPGDADQQAFNAYDRASRYRVARQLVPPGTSRRRMLDLGCSKAAWSAFWRQRGWEQITGVDLSLDRLLIARQRGYAAVNALAEELPFPDESFDFVASIDMLVHVLQPDDRRRVVREAYRLLRPGGCFLFSMAPAAGYGLRPGVHRHCSFVAAEEGYDMALGAGFAVRQRNGLQFFVLFRPWRMFNLLPRQLFYRGLATPADLLLGRTPFWRLARVVFYLAEKPNGVIA